MVAKVLSGKCVADAILVEARAQVEKLSYPPCLHIVKATRSKAQDSFIRMKVKA